MPTVASGSRIASPLLAWSRPAMIFSSEDLPVPLGPTTPIFAPCRNDRVTLSRTTLSPWALRTLRRVNTYSAMVNEPSCAPETLHIRDEVARCAQELLRMRSIVGAGHEGRVEPTTRPEESFMNETYVTLRGWLGADVRHRLAGDTPVAEFRLGVTPRWFDPKRSEWVDAPTQWYTVKAW